MTRYSLIIFGVTIFSWEVLRLVVEDDEEEAAEIGGGSSQNFERDFNPPIPGTDKDYDSWADRPFGFRRSE